MGTVNRLETVLTQIETRLQAFFEGRAARLFPNGDCAGWAPRLVRAMQDQIQLQPDGSLLAPNLFTIIVHPAAECALTEKAGILDEMSAIIKRSAEEASLRFLAPPVIRVITDTGLSSQEVQVLAAFGRAGAGDTSLISLAEDLPEPAWKGTRKARGEQMIPPAFLIVDDSRAIPLPRQGLTIGRGPDMALVLDNPYVSRVHAQIRLVQDRYVIFDLDSSGGTYVNGQRVTQCVLHPGDVISLAGAQLVFGQEGRSTLDDTKELILDSPL